MAEFRLGTVGKPIRLFVKEVDPATGLKTAKDLSTAQVQQIKFNKPRGGAVVTQTSTFVTDGTDGGLEYPFVDGDLDETGTWEVMAYWELLNGEKDHSSRANFKVGKIIGEGA